jgi:tRNA A37 threonylcarbamoyltransferase TsaD
VRILIAVRHLDELPPDLEQLAAEGVEATFSLGMEHTEQRVREEEFQLVVMAGGIEPQLRGTIKAWCAQHLPSARILDVYTRDALCDAVRAALPAE